MYAVLEFINHEMSLIYTLVENKFNNLNKFDISTKIHYYVT